MRSLFVAILLLLPLPAHAFTLEQLLPTIARHDAFVQPFTETRYMAMLQEPLTVTGTLSFTPPAHIEKTVISPIEEQLIIQDGMIRIRRKEAKSYSDQTIAISQHPVLAALFSSLAGTITGNKVLLDQEFTLALTGNQAQWVLTLTPKSEEARKYLRHIILSGQGNEVRQIEVQETSQDRSVMRLGKGGV